MSRHPRSRALRARGNEGTALVLALLFLTVCGAIVGGLLTYANTTSRATASYRLARSDDYDAIAAMQAAIANARTGVTCGTGANGFTPTWTLNDPARPLRVDCFAISSQTGVTARRDDVLSVCPSAVAAPCPDSSSLLRVEVIFYDVPIVGTSVGIQTWSSS